MPIASFCSRSSCITLRALILTESNSSSSCFLLIGTFRNGNTSASLSCVSSFPSIFLVYLSVFGRNFAISSTVSSMFLFNSVISSSVRVFSSGSILY